MDLFPGAAESATFSNPPRVSIIMSVRNVSATLQASLDSIVHQTFTDWEFVICDDASDDATPDILARFREEMGNDRVTLLANAENRKLAFSLNRCLDFARGEFIARMDGDDLSEPQRLEEQVRYLEQHPDIDVVGTAMRRFNEQGDGEVIYPASDTPDKWTLGRGSASPFFHATILARRAAYDTVGNYTVSWRTERGQDLDLWFKFFGAGLQGRNLREPLYRVREDSSAIRRRTARTRIGAYVTRLKGNRLLGYPPSAYVRCTLDVLKIFVPYKVFDWHRQRSFARAEVSKAQSRSA